MNQKTAKKLRSLANSMATEPLQYVQGTNTKKDIVRNKLYDSTAPSSMNNMPFEIQQYEVPGTRFCNPKSARAIYQQLKKAHKQSK